MSWVPSVLAGLGGLGGLFGNRPQRVTTTQSQQQNQQGSYWNTGNTTSLPVLNPLAGQGYEAIARQYMDLINKDPNLTGYQAQQSGNINQLADIQRRNTEESLASRGIAGPAVGTALGNVESQRVGSQIGLNQQIPLLARQLQETTLGNAGGFFRGIPVGTDTTIQGTGATAGSGNQFSTGSTNYPGNQLGGLFGGLGAILANLYGQGAFGGGGGITQSFSH